MVCGSSQGIGWAAAWALAEMGAELILCARNPERLQQRCEELNDAFPLAKASYWAADFQKPQEVERAVQKYLEDHQGPIHILVNNTGGPPGGPANAAGIEEFERAFQAHLICNHVLAQAVLGGMKAAGYGRIINVISTSVKQPLPNLGVSNTVRGAVANWSKTLANELGEFGITVNNVLPGATRTARLESILHKKCEQMGISMEEASAQMIKAIPAKRFAEPEEVAAAIAFLASPSAGYINGVNLPVDGGRTGSL
jgi:3-oxoacyl-[acyl-carrier protein] reductase